jgi:hypothetical protein
VVNALALALLAAIEPLGVVAFIAVLGSHGGRRNTRGFIVGWVLCACLVALVTILAEGRSHPQHVSTMISSAGLLQIALGGGALVYLLYRYRRDPAALESSDEAVLKEDHLGPIGAALIAAGVQGWPVVAGAVSAVMKSTGNTTGQLLGVAAVVVVSASSFIVAHALAGREPERTAAWLGAVKNWIESHRDRVINLLLLCAGGYLVVHGVLAQIAK